MKMIEIMKKRMAEIVERAAEEDDKSVRETGAMYKNMVGEMNAALLHEAEDEGINILEMTALCATFGVAHKILSDLLDTEGKTTASAMIEMVYGSTRTIMTRRHAGQDTTGEWND